MPTSAHKDEEAALPASDVVLVVFDGVGAIDVAGPASVFSKAELLRPGTYRLHLASPAGGSVQSNSGLGLSGTCALRELPGEIDTLIVAGGDEAPVLTGSAASHDPVDLQPGSLAIRSADDQAPAGIEIAVQMLLELLLCKLVCVHAEEYTAGPGRRKRGASAGPSMNAVCREWRPFVLAGHKRRDYSSATGPNTPALPMMYMCGEGQPVRARDSWQRQRNPSTVGSS